MATNQANSGGSIGLGGALTLLFIGLKLAHVIDWPWKWVLSPLWIPFVIVLAIFVVGFPIFLLVGYIRNRR